MSDALNYSMANEDTQVEMDILPRETDRVVTIAGSGSRVIPLLTKRPKRLDIVDTSKSHLEWTDLRLATLKNLPFEKYKMFWGYSHAGMANTPQAVHLRQGVLESIQLSMDSRDSLMKIFSREKWKAPIYYGKWEKTVRLLSGAIRLTCGPGVYRIFNCETMASQSEYLNTEFPIERWNFAVRILAQFGFSSASLDTSIRNTLAKENFFLKFLLNGKVKGEDVLPLEADKSVYEAASKAAAACDIRFDHGSLSSHLAKARGEVDFVSSSDSLASINKKETDRFYRALERALRPGGTIVSRYYRHQTPNKSIPRFQDASERYGKIIRKEKTGRYRIESLEISPS